jgi:glyoxylase-like metal-dependent hydrolase (beta-lactamase superfamily II)
MKNELKYSQEIFPGIYRITLPLPGDKPGPVSAYLFVGEKTSLLDTGTARASIKLQKAFKELCIRPEDIRQVIISHGHMDHYGSASWVVSSSGGRAKVFAHKSDSRRIETGVDVSAKTYRSFMKLMGVPYWHRHGLQILQLIFRSMAKNCPIDGHLDDNETIQIGDYEGRIIFTPGHTKGSICIFLENEELLFSGDHILSHITPNALIMLKEGYDLPKRLSQKEFYESVDKIERLKPKMIYPAHGPTISDLSAVAEMYRKSFEEREKKILSIIEKKEFSAYQIARKLFPNMDARRLPLEIFLSISEVFSHLQILRLNGVIEFQIEKGMLRINRK